MGGILYKIHNKQSYNGSEYVPKNEIEKYILYCIVWKKILKFPKVKLKICH
jgi:hypothetical protein